VVKTDLISDKITKEMIHGRYKDLAIVEGAFRNCKAEQLEMRPIHVRLESRTRGHVLVVMLAYLIIRELAQRKLKLNQYIEQQAAVIKECVRALSPNGSICWQVGKYVDNGSIIPLDAILYPIFVELGLKMRNRIVWHFEHGLHCSKRFSGRYETVNWFTKSSEYVFNLDPVRIPQKYPGKKYFKGPNAGKYYCNPLGKNPGDVWIIPNIKSNHVKKQYILVNAEKCRTKVSKEKTMKGKILYSPIEMNKSFDALLKAKSWQESRVSYWVTKSEKLIRKTLTMPPEEQKKEIESAGEIPIFSYNQTDFVKDRVAVEVQFCSL